MLPENFDLKRIRTFQLVAKHGGLRIAAMRLNLTIPAISIQIRKLEEELGKELFKRSPRGLMLTNAGETLLRSTEAIFREVEGALSSLDRGNQLSGRIAVSSGSDVVWFFTPKLSSFVKHHPNVELRHHVYNSFQTLGMVRSGIIDVGIGYFPEPPKDMVKETVRESRITLLYPTDHPLARAAQIRLNDLIRYKVILPPGQSFTRKVIETACVRNGIKLHNVIEVGSCQTAFDFVENGVGIALVHALCVSQRKADNVQMIDFSAYFGKIGFSVVYRSDSLNSALARAFLEHLTDTARSGG